MIKGPASPLCAVLLVLAEAAGKILALKVGTFIHLTFLHCQPACLVSLNGALACLPA
jgi:hypothetical protein